MQMFLFLIYHISLKVCPLKELVEEEELESCPLIHESRSSCTHDNESRLECPPENASLGKEDAWTVY